MRSGELLFIKSVKDGIPNRDPLNDSDARRIFGEEDGRISLSDVSIKRDVRDYVLARFPEGGSDKRNFVFVRKERKEDGKLLGRSSLARTLLENAGLTEDDTKAALCKAAFDVRVFGAVFSVKKENFQLTGPVQFGWAHSLHPVETIYAQGTVVMPSEEDSATQGTIWTSYTLPFAVFAMPAVINASIARESKMDEQDVELLLEALWRGTHSRQARGRGIQQPLMLVHVEYEDPFFRLGYLEEGIALRPEAEEWKTGHKPSSVDAIELDVTALAERLNGAKDRIARIRYWVDPLLKVTGMLPGERQDIW